MGAAISSSPRLFLDLQSCLQCCPSPQCGKADVDAGVQSVFIARKAEGALPCMEDFREDTLGNANGFFPEAQRPQNIPLHLLSL